MGNFGNSGIGLAAGLLQGIAQGRQAKQQREIDKERRAEQKELNALRKLDMQRKSKRDDILYKILESGMGGASPVSKPADFGESFGTAAAASATGTPGVHNVSLTDQMAGSSMASNLSPKAAAILKEITGIDFLGAQRLSEQREHYDAIEAQADKRIDQQTRANDLREEAFRSGTAGFFDQEIPGKGTVRVPYSKGGAQPTLTKLTKKEYAIPENELPLWRNAETLEAPPVGRSPVQAEAEGYNRITAAQLDKVISFNQVDEILASVENMMNDVFPKEEGLLGRITGGIPRKVGAATQTNTEAAKLEKFIMGTLAPVIRTMGEKGALSDTDVKRAANLYPSLTDRADVAWGMLEELKNVIARNKKGLLGKSKAKKPGLPAAAIKQLKEGMKTKFGNGQIWTLKNGEPVRIE